MDDLGKDLITGGLIDDLNEPPILPEPLANAGLKKEKFTTKKRAAAKKALRAQRRIPFVKVVLMLLVVLPFDGTDERGLKRGTRKASRAVVDGGGTIVGLAMAFLKIGAVIVELNLLATKFDEG
jgi:hypothetical protein